MSGTPEGHIVDSSNHDAKVSPELAALDAAMAATDGMGDWQLFRRQEAHARILEAALNAAAPLIRADELERFRRFSRAFADGSDETSMAALYDEAMATGARAERERIAQLALAEAGRGAKSGLDRIALRAFAQHLSEESP